MGGGGGAVVLALRGRERGREGREAEEWPASGQRSAVLSRLWLLPQSPLPSTNTAWGFIESLCPAPCPLGGEGGGGGGVTSLRRAGEGWGKDGTDQTPGNRTCSGVSPCSSEPQPRLRQRWGEQRKREGEALKETAATVGGGGYWGQWPREGRVSSWKEGGPGLLGPRGGKPEDRKSVV